MRLRFPGRAALARSILFVYLIPGGLLFIPLWLAIPDGLIGLTVRGLAFSNIVVGIYNLIPGLPFDLGSGPDGPRWILRVAPAPLQPAVPARRRLALDRPPQRTRPLPEGLEGRTRRIDLP